MSSQEKAIDGFPDSIKDYKPVKFIGEGGFGKVFLVKDNLDELHALKVLNLKDFSTKELYEKEFHALRTWREMAKNNAGLVSISHIGNDPDEEFYYYLMKSADCADGISLLEFLNYEPSTLEKKIQSTKGLSIDEVYEITKALAKSIHFLHQKDFIHRDIKLDNIIFIDKKPVLCDLSLYKSVASPKTLSGGTPGYIDPNSHSEKQGDVYSLGKTIYRMLGGNIDHFPKKPPSIIASDAFSACEKLLEELSKKEDILILI